MLYALRELQQAALAPLTLAARANLALLSMPFSGLSYHPFRRHIAAGSELLVRLTQRYEKPAFGLHTTTVGNQEVAVAERVALERPFCRLLHFERAVQHRDDPTVLVVAPLSGHHSTLLRDTVRAMLPDHEVYITDWTDARLVPLAHGPFHLDDYVDYVRDFMHFLGAPLHVVAVCQPAVPVLAAVSLMNAENDPDTPRTMTLMGGPIDTRRGPTSVNEFARSRSIDWFESHLIHRVPPPYAGMMRRVYPGFLQHAAFISMNADRHARAYRDFFDHLVQGDEDSAAQHRAFYDEYNAVLDMPAEFYLDTVATVFQEHALPRGEMRVRGELVRPEAVTRTALFTIEGERDDITGMGQTVAAHELCSRLPDDKRQHYLAMGVGHYGIFNGRRYREQIYPRVRDFIREHG